MQDEQMLSCMRNRGRAVLEQSVEGDRVACTCLQACDGLEELKERNGQGREDW
jgi:hypothetical protein